eukprot:379630-Amphidinium_carterae.1
MLRRLRKASFISQEPGEWVPHRKHFRPPILFTTKDIQYVPRALAYTTILENRGKRCLPMVIFLNGTHTPKLTEDVAMQVSLLGAGLATAPIYASFDVIQSSFTMPPTP